MYSWSITGWCFSQYEPSHKAGHPGYLHGVFGFLGMCYPFPLMEQFVQLILEDVPDLLCIADLPVSHNSSIEKAPARVSLQRPFHILDFHCNDITGGRWLSMVFSGVPMFPAFLFLPMLGYAYDTANVNHSSFLLQSAPKTDNTDTVSPIWSGIPCFPPLLLLLQFHV